MTRNGQNSRPAETDPYDPQDEGPSRPNSRTSRAPSMGSLVIVKNLFYLDFVCNMFDFEMLAIRHIYKSKLGFGLILLILVPG